MRELILLRGLPGAGKTTLANIIAPHTNVAADDYFDVFHEGVFKPHCLKSAHGWCKERCELMLKQDANVVVVHNTFTQDWEMEDYYFLAQDYGYRCHTMVVENRHGEESVHSVPEETIEKMRQRFQVEL